LGLEVKVSKKKPADFGYNERSKKLKDERARIKQHVQERIDHYIISVIVEQKKKLDEQETNAIYSTVFKEFKAKYPKFTNYRYARNFFSKLINDGNKTDRWLLPVPSYIYRYHREALFRNERWFLNSRALNAWHITWLKELSDCRASRVKRTTNNVLGNCLISAIVYGGLCIPEAVDAFKESLLREKRMLISNDHGIHINLVFDSKSQLHNTVIDDKPITIRRWYPDPFTLSWIHHFLGLADNHANDLFETGTWKVIKSVLTEIDVSVLRSITSMKSLCNASIGVTENIPQVELNQASIGYIVGIISSASLPIKLNDTVFTKVNYGIHICEQMDYHNASMPSSARHFGPKNPFNAEKWIKDIRIALAINDVSRHKRSPSNAIDALTSIKDDDSNFQLQLLISWLIYLLKDQGLKVSTVSRYWSAIGASWLAHTADVELSDLNVGSFESLYKDMLTISMTENNRYFMSARFDQFHLFLHRNYGFPLLPLPLNDNSKAIKPFVHAMYIPKAAFSQVLNVLDKTISDVSLRQALRVYFIIAIRSAMRIGELSKLQMNDIEHSRDCWLFIRNNKYGNNKSGNALRKLPLNVLLLDNERAEVERYIATRRLLAKDENIMLFSESNSPHIPLYSNWVGNVFSKIASSVMEVGCTFHGLRHTALSNMHLVLEDELAIVNRFVGYSAEQITNIQQMLGNTNSTNKKLDKYWVLAGFAGHESPATTFANYLHFTDYIVGKSLREAYYSIPPEAIKTASGLTANALTRLSVVDVVNNEWHDKLLAKVELQLNGAIVIHKPIAKFLNEDDKTQNVDVIKSKRISSTIEICYAILKDVENSSTMEEIVNQYNVSDQLVVKWITNARMLANIKTPKGFPRLVSRFAIKNSEREVLTPKKPASNSELLEVNTAVKKLRILFVSQQDELIWCIKYYITHSNRNEPHIKFDNINEFVRFLSILKEVFPASRWQFKLRIPQNCTEEDIAIWDEKLNILAIKTNKTTFENSRKRKIRGKLRLRHVDETEFIKNEKQMYDSYSARTLGYVFHMLAIMVLSFEF
jgi:integrase